MAEAKPFASLTSGLLARKGQARPAMRPQGFNHVGAQDDLGWNDMGHPRPHVVTSDERPCPPRPVPHVVRQQEEIAQEFSPAAEFPDPAAEVLPTETRASPQPAKTERAIKARAPAKVTPPAKRAVTPRSKATGKPRAAFTLRLEQERHLKLRLACAVTGRSAQQLVTDALEQLLRSMPEIEALAGHVPARTTGTKQ